MHCLCCISLHLSYQSEVTLTNQRDELYWRWTAYGVYSASSFYRVLRQGGTVRWHFMIAWQCKAPTTVKIFSNLMLREKVLTRENLIERGIQCDARCAMCNSGELESAMHLFFKCRYAKEVWTLLVNNMQVQLMYPTETVQQTWVESWNRVKQTGCMDEKNMGNLG